MKGLAVEMDTRSSARERRIGAVKQMNKRERAKERERERGRERERARERVKVRLVVNTLRGVG